MLYTNPGIVQKVAIPETLRLIAPGETAYYTRDDLGGYMSVYSAINRLNAEAAWEEFDLDQNIDGDYIITRMTRK